MVAVLGHKEVVARTPVMDRAVSKEVEGRQGRRNPGISKEEEEVKKPTPISNSTKLAH